MEIDVNRTTDESGGPVTKELLAVIGCEPDAWCNAYMSNRPSWIRGSLSHSDTRFLFKAVLNAGVSTIVEIGTGSGFSTGLLCQALHFASQAGIITSDFQVISYDISRNVFRDEMNRRVGDAAREQLSPELLEHIVFRNPARASDLKDHHGTDAINFLFIDANHGHPWPTLDLLASLDSLSPQAIVALHDINLPMLGPEHPDWGAKYLFDGLDVDKSVPDDAAIPNIGRITVPQDKEQLRSRLLEILFTHEWQDHVSEDYLVRLGISR